MLLVEAFLLLITDFLYPSSSFSIIIWISFSTSFFWANVSELVRIEFCLFKSLRFSISLSFLDYIADPFTLCPGDDGSICLPSVVFSSSSLDFEIVLSFSGTFGDTCVGDVSFPTATFFCLLFFFLRFKSDSSDSEEDIDESDEEDWESFCF
jgi:hypothetical protein